MNKLLRDRLYRGTVNNIDNLYKIMAIDFCTDITQELKDQYFKELIETQKFLSLLEHEPVD